MTLATYIVFSAIHRRNPDLDIYLLLSQRTCHYKMSDEIDERKPYLDILIDWFSANVKGVRPHKKREYAELFYDHNLTTERRILIKLARNPYWLTENNVDEFDSEDILEYLRTKGLVTTPKAAQTSGR